MPPAPLPPPAPSYSPTPPLCIVCSFPFLYETVINGQGGGLMCGDCEGAVRFVGDEKWRRDNQELPMSGAPLSGAHTPPLETALQVGLQTGLFKTSLQASLNSSLQPSILSPLPPDLVALLPPSLPPSVPPSVPPSIPFPPTSTLAPALAPALNSTLTASDVLFCLTQTERNYLLKRVRKLEWTSPAKLYELTVRVYDISRRYDEERNKKKEAKERIPSQLPHAMEQSRQALPELPAPVQTPAPNPTLDPLQVLLTGAELTDELDKVQPECDNPNNSSPEESELVVVNGREFPTYVGAAKASAAAPVTKEAMAEEQETKNEDLLHSSPPGLTIVSFNTLIKTAAIAPVLGGGKCYTCLGPGAQLCAYEASSEMKIIEHARDMHQIALVTESKKGKRKAAEEMVAVVAKEVVPEAVTVVVSGNFTACAAFNGGRDGYFFSTRSNATGYFKDARSASVT